MAEERRRELDRAVTEARRSRGRSVPSVAFSQVVTQEMTDALVARIRALVARRGGAGLGTLRGLYSIFHKCPEHAAFTFLSAEVERLEREGV